MGEKKINLKITECDTFCISLSKLQMKLFSDQIFVCLFCLTRQSDNAKEATAVSLRFVRKPRNTIFHRAYFCRRVHMCCFLDSSLVYYNIIIIGIIDSLRFCVDIGI